MTDKLNATPKNCGTCKHWKEEKYDQFDDADELEVHECKNIDPYWEAQEYKDGDYDKKHLTESGKKRLAFAQDGSGYMAKLLTKVEFSCNMWEAK
jgi:hypothetical protein